MSLSADLPFDWDKVIDASVYGGSGLRMLWSHKKPTGDPYVPWRSLTTGEEFSKEPSADVLALFAIRSTTEDQLRDVSNDVVAFTDLEDFVQKYMDGQSRYQIK